MIRIFLPILFLIGLATSTVMAQFEVVTEEEVNVEGKYIEANQLKLLGKLDEALKKFEEIVRQQRDNHGAHYEIARIYEARGDWPNAEKSIRNAIRYNPVEPWYRVKIVDILESQKKYAEAAEEMRQLVPMRPDQEALYDRWIQLLIDAEAPHKAVQVLQEQEQHFGLTLQLTRKKAAIYHSLGDTESAISVWEALIERFPDNPQFLRAFAIELTTLDQNERAISLYQQILALNPDDPEAQLALVRLSSADLPIYKRLDALAPLVDDPDVSLDRKIKSLIPFVSELQSTPDTILAGQLHRLTDRLLDQYPADAKIFAIKADIYNQMSEHGPAADFYEKTVQLNPSIPGVWEQYLYALYETRRYEELLTATEKAIDLFPNQANHYLLNGAALMAQGEWADAIAATDQALLMAGRNRLIAYLASFQIARCYHEAGEFEQRDAQIENALTISESAPEALAFRYAWQLPLKHADSAFAKKLRESADEHPNDSALSTLVFLREKWQPSGGVSPKDIAPSLQTNALGFYFVAEALSVGGNPEKAADFYEKALKMGLKLPEAQCKFNRLITEGQQ
jgi:tetratricopeptide (TPR) repeat protein